EELAAVIVEPMNQAAAGMRIYPAGYLAKLRAACDRNKVLLIADEIAMGYGRSGKMFACEHAGIAPDILCLGKGMSAGYLPISATVVTEEIYSSFRDTPDADRTFYHGHTFTGNPIACAAAVETLKVFEEENVLGNMRPTMGVLADELAAFSELDCVGDVRQIGMVGAIELVADKREKTPFPSDMRLGRKICIEARRRGALLRPLGDVLYLWPPLNISNEQLRELAGILRKSIETALN
ncbi:MAG: aminotransferase class III-fold pyridoxal phosphate-dependent enzyme, partial [Armatimonadota bacterium]|nr:aminotransferase class III-fold pyridoxal phosphate-dependent enzyme [Armatimonadota bacterium]